MPTATVTAATDLTSLPKSAQAFITEALGQSLVVEILDHVEFVYLYVYANKGKSHETCVKLHWAVTQVGGGRGGRLGFYTSGGSRAMRFAYGENTSRGSAHQAVRSLRKAREIVGMPW